MAGVRVYSRESTTFQSPVTTSPFIGVEVAKIAVFYRVQIIEDVWMTERSRRFTIAAGVRGCRKERGPIADTTLDELSLQR